MKDFAVICAHNPESSNLGMYSVDLAARSYFEQLGASFDLFVSQGVKRVGVLDLKRFRTGSDLSGYRNVVYWGDFQNNPIWGAADYAYREVKLEGARSVVDGFETWRELYLRLYRNLSAGTRMYAIGGCYLGARGNSFSSDVAAELDEFIAACAAVVPRDTESERVISAALGASSTLISPGFDCAALLGKERIRTRGDYFLYFFGRSMRLRDARPLVRQLERMLGIRGRWMRWLGRSVPLLQDIHGRYIRYSELISRAKFVLTDTYHLCINSLLRGTPAVALGRGVSEATSTRSDAKKFILYSMIEQPGMVFDLGESREISRRTIDGVTERALSVCSSEEARLRSLGSFEVKRERFKRVLDSVFGGKSSSRGDGLPEHSEGLRPNIEQLGGNGGDESS